MSKTGNMLEMRKISKRFGAVEALRQVDFEVDQSEIVGLIGDNGAGKSTLIKIISGVYSADEGKFFFDGREVRFSSPHDAKNLGIETVYQDLALVENISLARNVFLGREFVKPGIGRFFGLADKRRIRGEARKALKSLDIEIDSVTSLVENLSGGQRQAVAIARTVYWEPKLLIMDEPTAAISVKETRKVLDLMKAEKMQGISVIFISHNLQEIFSVVDRVVVLNRGEVVGNEMIEKITVEEVIKLMVGK